MKSFFFVTSLSLAIVSFCVFFVHQMPFYNLAASVGMLAAFLFFSLGLLCQVLEPAENQPPESEG
jgi:hypothetical protein